MENPWSFYNLKKNKKTFFILGIILISAISLGSFFIFSSVKPISAKSNLCSQPVDMVMILDRSGSMDYSSRCDWWQLKCLNPPSCSSGYNWAQITTYNQSQAWCQAKNQAAPHQAVYLAINPKKIIAAKEAANNFLNLLGPGDQSALVSYANNATLDKTLSNNHLAAETAVNSLSAYGATNIGEALKLGNDELSSNRAKLQAIKAMILLTDGKANKPNGPGFGEYPADLAYALAQANTAAAQGFKIFTIGLGDNGEINEAMLEEIASSTGAAYYHAPSPNDLAAIYNSIAWRLCRFGSIAGCKYSDADKDGVIDGEEKLSSWEIKLNHDENLTQLTGANGCYLFSGLLPGSYTVSEVGKTGVVYEQTYPASGNYAIDLAEGDDLIDKDFGNYLPICGNSFVDQGTGEVCEIGQSQNCEDLYGYKGRRSCKTDCSGWDECIPTEFCGDNIINDSEECDTNIPRACTAANGYAGEQSCVSCHWGTCENQGFCGDGLVNGREECDTNEWLTCLTPAGYAGEQTCANCQLDPCQSDGFCGDGLKNGLEQCDDGNTNNDDDCKNDCTLCQAKIDLMMVLDRSGSMGYTSSCDWWQLKCLNPPSCSLGYAWVKNTAYNQSQAWCNAKNQPAPRQSVWTDYGENKINKAKEAANGFLDLLGPGDQSGLVSYANNATLNKTLSNNHPAAKTAVNSLITNGATDIGDAISLANNELMSSRASPGAVKIMILLTDGMANKPSGPGYGEYAPDVAYALTKANEAAAAGIKIFTIGLGADVNTAMLQQIASSTGGDYHFAPTAADLQNIFNQIGAETCQKVVINIPWTWNLPLISWYIKPKDFI